MIVLPMPLKGSNTSSLGFVEIFDRVRNQLYGLHRRVHFQVIKTAVAKRIRACIVPDICSVSAVSPQLHIVRM